MIRKWNLAIFKDFHERLLLASVTNVISYINPFHEKRFGSRYQEELMQGTQLE